MKLLWFVKFRVLRENLNQNDLSLPFTLNSILMLRIALEFNNADGHRFSSASVTCIVV
jgi:hypothetical protein